MNSNGGPMLGKHNHLGRRAVQRASKHDIFEPNRDSQGMIRSREDRAWKKDQQEC